MKKAIKIFMLIALFSASIYSCKKDDTTDTPSNSITIEGSFTLGDQTFTNPTFDLGTPEENVGLMITPTKQIMEGIRISPLNDSIDLGNDVLAYYTFYFPTTELGHTALNGFFEVYTKDELNYFYIYAESAVANITKIDEVGGYIEGTYEGLFYLDKKSIDSWYLKGHFKVKRAELTTK